MKSILFVCQGNICRSPALQAVFEKKLKENGRSDWHVDSCAMTSYFIGAPVDKRMQVALKKRGIDFCHTARPFEPSDYKIYDYIFVISHDMAAQLRADAPPEAKEKIFLASHFAQKGKDLPIPDPYYATHDGFTDVLHFIEHCVDGIYKALVSKA